MTDIHTGVFVDAIEDPVEVDTMSARYVLELRPTSFDTDLNDRFVVLQHEQLAKS